MKRFYPALALSFLLPACTAPNPSTPESVLDDLEYNPQSHTCQVPATAATALSHKPAGGLDRCFGNGGTLTTPVGSGDDEARAVAVKNGKIVVAGYADGSFALVRYNRHDGSLDSGFGTGGKVLTKIGSGDDVAFAVAIQDNNKIVLVGRSTNDQDDDFALVRYNKDGSLDTSFGEGGKIKTDFNSSSDEDHAVAIQDNGKIVVAGFSYNGEDDDFAVARYNSNGSLDTGFGTGGKVTTPVGPGDDIAYAMALQSNGKIVLAGRSSSENGFDFSVVRYNSNGSLDSSFDEDGKATTDFGFDSDEAHAIAIQDNRKIVVAGFVQDGSSNSFAMVRYNSNGSLDTSFGMGGKVTTAGDLSGEARAVALQDDGKILLAGRIGASEGDNDFALARYNRNGLLDGSFGTGGKVTTAIGAGDDKVFDMAIQSNGRIVLVGSSFSGTDYDFAVARYYP